jgi:hypothetical protein
LSQCKNLSQICHDVFSKRELPFLAVVPKKLKYKKKLQYFYQRYLKCKYKRVLKA